MSGQRSNTNTPPQDVRARRRRVVSLGASAGAFVAFSLSALSTSPAAYADDFGFGDWIADLFGHVDDISQGTGDAVGDSSALAAQVALATVDTVNPAADMVTAPADAWFQQLIYEPIHTAIENWISSPVGEQVGGFINQISGQFLIGDGSDGTAAHPDGGAGGLWFGDGGDGYDQSANAGVAGGAGGDAGWFGNGGDGGAGGAGAAGGDGGDGGQLFGIGGDGGNAGDGGVGLPALGGAGGNAGMLGQHGTVGHYGTLAGGPPAQDSGGLSTTGTWLTNSDGQVVVPHGFNYSMEYAGTGSDSDAVISDANAAFLADNGFNVVRLAISWAGVEPEPGVFNDAYLASVDQTVQALASHGIRAIIDMHQDAYSSVFGYDGAPAWAVQDGGLSNPSLSFPLAVFFNPAENHAWDAFWVNADASNGLGLENNYAQMWEYVADYFKGNAGVAGFEIMNEPYSGSQTLPSLLGSPFFEAQQLTPFYDQVTSAIRSVDSTTPVFFEPSMLPATAGYPTALGTVDFPHTVYSFHDYCEFPLGPLGCLPNVAGIVSNAEAYAQAHNIPAFMTEFGFSTDNASIAATMRPADQNMMGWAEWAFSGQGPNSLVYDPSQPPVGDNVNTAQLETLAQPYPQVVAGTPESYSFDNGTFHFSYSTERADGSGDFAAGSQTEIALPKIQFPDGYQVSVVGGHVVSDANATELIIASDTGATTVNVTVTAAPST